MVIVFLHFLGIASLLKFWNVKNYVIIIQSFYYQHDLLLYVWFNHSTTSTSRDMVSATIGRQSRTPNKWKPSKIGKKRQWPLWPWTWPYDLGVVGVCRPCLYPPTIPIWWWSKIIKAVKCVFQGLTLKSQYLTLRAKNQNSAALIFCIWP